MYVYRFAVPFISGILLEASKCLVNGATVTYIFEKKKIYVTLNVPGNKYVTWSYHFDDEWNG
jgi:hypothetical protein